MIDEIPIIGVTAWTVEGLAAKVDFADSEGRNTAGKSLHISRTVLGMSKQFFYVHLKLTPKSVSLAAPIGDPHEIVVEVPRGLLHQRQSDLVGQGFTDKAIALDIARDVALKTATPFPAIGERAAGLYDEDRPIWYEDRHRVMNQRPCDHEERGIRAWKID